MYTLGLALGHSLVDGLADDSGIHGILLGNGVSDQHTALLTQDLLHMEGLGHFIGGIQLIVHAEAGGAGVEGRQLLGAVADDGDALGLQVFQGQAQVQNGLGSGADHQHRGLGQLLQVGGNVHGGLRAPMHAADAARGKDLDARHGGDHHGGGDGAGAVHALGYQHGQNPAAGLGHGVASLAQVVDLLRGQARLQAAADDGDGSGHSAAGADDLLYLQGRLLLLGIGHTMGDDGAFQGHNGLALVQGLLYLGCNVQITVQHNEIPPVLHYIFDRVC